MSTISQAKTLFEQGDYLQAVVLLTQVLAKDAQNIEVLLLRAEILIKMNQGPQALKDVQILIALKPHDASVLLVAGKTYTSLGLFDKAIENLDQAIGTDPQSADAYKERGRVRYLLHDKLGSSDDLRRALELSPHEAQNFDGNYNKE